MIYVFIKKLDQVNFDTISQFNTKFILISCSYSKNKI